MSSVEYTISVRKDDDEELRRGPAGLIEQSAGDFRGAIGERHHSIGDGSAGPHFERIVERVGASDQRRLQRPGRRVAGRGRDRGAQPVPTRRNPGNRERAVRIRLHVGRTDADRVGLHGWQ